ncbi:HEAT repeat domain-containing protein [Streptomyces sp. AJS327]|uniref:HEAT repeat domain-containing protein n=1 Tax=Streptomyces sp. AJS327 TaxID=2545265 RepID=UPI0015DF6B6D|nr:HEAT repeat domain-containing protein [Streptomyces sp. AJS327]MBA0052179.1 HEAT repeat domain-containing protein [Streptomyces sp. AJS327]
MGDAFRSLIDRVRTEADPVEYSRLVKLARQRTPEARDRLATVLVEPQQPLWAREVAAFALGSAGDRRAFETLVFLLNYRDPVCCATAAQALELLRDPRTARAAAALATNELRTAYALYPVRLLTALRAPESVPTLIKVLQRLLIGPVHYWPIAEACVQGLGALGDRRAIPVLDAAAEHHRLCPSALAARARIPY